MKEIKTINGKIIKVDDEMYDRCMYFNWSAWKHGNTWYARTNVKTPEGKYKQITMHQLVMDFKPKNIDHKDRNGLNNQKENIRTATHSQNAMNNKKRINTSSKFKGVCWDKRRKKWGVYLRMNGIQINYGFFKCEVVAALIYDINAIEVYGEFARPNFLFT